MFWDKICSWLGWQAGAGEMTAQGVPDKKLLEREIAAWLGSPERIWQLKGHLYYAGEQDILTRRRTAIGERGELQPVENLPNNRVIDNQYAKMVNQKANYLLGQPFVLECPNRRYAGLLGQVLDRRFMPDAEKRRQSGSKRRHCLAVPRIRCGGAAGFPAHSGL